MLRLARLPDDEPLLDHALVQRALRDGQWRALRLRHALHDAIRRFWLKVEPGIVTIADAGPVGCPLLIGVREGRSFSDGPAPVLGVWWGAIRPGVLDMRQPSRDCTAQQGKKTCNGVVIRLMRLLRYGPTGGKLR
jgi:hypothetical protein